MIAAKSGRNSITIMMQTCDEGLEYVGPIRLYDRIVHVEDKQAALAYIQEDVQDWYNARQLESAFRIAEMLF